MVPEISLAEVQKHNNDKSVWMIIHNDVYDVTKYLTEHPGGEEILLENAGKESTQAFEDIGHSEDAREIMQKFKIGTIPISEQMATPVTGSAIGVDGADSGGWWKWALLFLAGAITVSLVVKSYK